MFCRKKCNSMEVVMKVAGGALALVGVAAVVGLTMSKSGNMGKKFKRFAGECSQAVGNTMDKLSDALEQAGNGNTQNNANGGSQQGGQNGGSGN